MTDWTFGKRLLGKAGFWTIAGSMCRAHCFIPLPEFQRFLITMSLNNRSKAGVFQGSIGLLVFVWIHGSEGNSGSLANAPTYFMKLKSKWYVFKCHLFKWCSTCYNIIEGNDIFFVPTYFMACGILTWIPDTRKNWRSIFFFPMSTVWPKNNW